MKLKIPSLLMTLLVLSGCGGPAPQPVEDPPAEFRTKLVEKQVFHTDFEEARRAAALSKKPLIAYFTYDG